MGFRRRLIVSGPESDVRESRVPKPQPHIADKKEPAAVLRARNATRSATVSSCALPVASLCSNPTSTPLERIALGRDGSHRTDRLEAAIPRPVSSVQRAFVRGRPGRTLLASDGLSARFGALCKEGSRVLVLRRTRKHRVVAMTPKQSLYAGGKCEQRRGRKGRSTD